MADKYGDASIFKPGPLNLLQSNPTQFRRPSPSSATFERVKENLLKKDVYRFDK